MLYFASRIKDIRAAIDGFPDDMIVVSKDSEIADWPLMIGVVYIDEYGRKVGTPKEDYIPKPGEVKALLFS